MKITKTELKNLIKESVVKESLMLARKQKRLSAYAKICLKNIPEAKTKKPKEKSLLEFFGSSDERETKMKKAAASYQKDVKELKKMANEVEGVRKKLVSTKLADLGAIQKTLNDYVGKLYDLYELQDMIDLEPKTQAEVSKPFANAANTLKKLSNVLEQASNDLFTAVPRSSKVYSAGQEATEIDAAKKKFMMGPGQRLKKLGKDIFDFQGAGGGIGRSRPK